MNQVLVASTGDWVAASFTGSVLPTFDYDVIIPNGVTITLTAPTAMQCRSLTFQGTGALVAPLASNGSTIRERYGIYYMGTGGISGGVGATPAAATATVAGGAVTAVTVTAAGTDYAEVPEVVAVGGGGSGAVFQVVLSGTTIGSVNVVEGGTGYTSDPTLYFIGGNATLQVLPSAKRMEMTTVGTYNVD